MTKAVAVGVLGTLILALFQRSLTFNTCLESLMGAAFLSLSMGFTGLPRALAAWIDGMQLSPKTLIAALMMFYIILGMFLDWISSGVLTTAILEPTIHQTGIDVIWFGIVSALPELMDIAPFEDALK